MLTESQNKFKSKNVALDTNMLLAIEKFKVDIFREIKKKFGRVNFIVPKQVLKGMEKLSRKNKTLEKQVNVAKKLMEKNKVRRKEVLARNADSALLKLAKSSAIATNDRVLKKKVKKLNGQIIYLRKKKYVCLC